METEASELAFPASSPWPPLILPLPLLGFPDRASLSLVLFLPLQRTASSLMGLLIVGILEL